MDFNTLESTLGSNFIEYSYEINSNRAIPDARSGLKPVAKRILWDMYVNKTSSNKSHVKCARTVGSVIGDWHPHGDTAVYEALVRLSQPWVLRYPLIDFHGNQGSQAGDSAAHMRYTESRLSKISEEGLLKNLEKKNVEMVLNYDDSKEEPVTLPAIFPNLLCNPNSGIGVAEASTWLPHNLTEVSKAIFDYIDGTEPYLNGPDFPTGGVVINKDDMKKVIATGKGSIKVRGKYTIEKNKIVFNELPYAVSTESLLKEIGKICDDKEIEGIEDVRDESNKNGLRLVIECEKNISNIESIVNQLFLKTNLQTSISYNQVALVNKTPTLLNLKDCIKIYLAHNVDCLKRETEFNIKKAERRKEIVEGLLKALVNIDDIIALIKKSESSTRAKERLIKVYNFTENQAKAILAMRLSSLAKLESIELNRELQTLTEDLKNWNLLITDKDKQILEIKQRLRDFVDKFGDARKTELLQIDITKEKEIIPEDVIVLVTKSGKITRISKNQKKGKKETMNKENILMASLPADTTNNLLVFTNKGKVYMVPVSEIPVGADGKRKADVSNMLDFEAGEEIAAVSVYPNETKKYVIFFTKKGLIKKSSLDEYGKMKRVGKPSAALKIKDGDSIVSICLADDGDEVLLVTKTGYSIRFSEADVSVTKSSAMGSKAIRLDTDDEVISAATIQKDSKYLGFFTNKGYGKKCEIEDFPLQARAGRGVIVHKANERSGGIVAVVSFSETDSNVMLVGTSNSTCLKIEDVPMTKRTSAPTRVTKNDVVSAIVF